MSAIKKWFSEFKRGLTFFEDDPCEGRPQTATALKTMEKLHDIVLDNRRGIRWATIFTRIDSTGILCEVTVNEPLAHHYKKKMAAEAVSGSQ